MATIYVVRRDWHIDVGFAVADLAPPLSSLAAAFPGVRYLVFGFGDRRYLQSRNKRLPNMIAALWPGRGLILMTALTATPGEAFGEREVIALPVDLQQVIAAETWVWTGLSKQQAAAQLEGPGPYPGSLYIETTANYSAVHTCNTWAAQVLQAAALPVHSAGVVFAAQLWGQAQRIARSLHGTAAALAQRKLSRRLPARRAGAV
jgi:hypothetical protein